MNPSPTDDLEIYSYVDHIRFWQFHQSGYIPVASDRQHHWAPTTCVSAQVLLLQNCSSSSFSPEHPDNSLHCPSREQNAQVTCSKWASTGPFITSKRITTALHSPERCLCVSGLKESKLGQLAFINPLIHNTSNTVIKGRYHGFCQLLQSLLRAYFSQ